MAAWACGPDLLPVGAVADAEQGGPRPRPARRQGPRPDQAGQQLGGLGEQGAAVVLVQPVLGGLADEQGPIGQPGQEQRQSAQVEGGVGAASPVGAAPGGPWRWAGTGRGRWPRRRGPTSRGMRTARTAPRTVVAATRPPTTEAAAFSGWPSIRAATARGSVEPGRGGGGHGQGGRGPEAPGHGDVGAHRDGQPVVADARRWPRVAARWVASSARSDPSPWPGPSDGRPAPPRPRRRGRGPAPGRRSRAPDWPTRQEPGRARPLRVVPAPVAGPGGSAHVSRVQAPAASTGAAGWPSHAGRGRRRCRSWPIDGRQGPGPAPARMPVRGRGWTRHADDVLARPGQDGDRAPTATSGTRACDHGA